MSSVLDAVNAPSRLPHQARAPSSLSITYKPLLNAPFSEELPSAELDHGLTLHFHPRISLDL